MIKIKVAVLTSIYGGVFLLGLTLSADINLLSRENRGGDLL